MIVPFCGYCLITNHCNIVGNMSLSAIFHDNIVSSSLEKVSATACITLGIQLISSITVAHEIIVPLESSIW